MRNLVALALTSALALTACGDDHDDHDDHEHEDPAAEACEHATDGPFVSVTAAAPESAPAIQSHTHSYIDITLAPGAASVALNAEAGEYTFYLSDTVAFSVTAGGAALELEASGPVTDCEALEAQHTVDLPSGEVILTFDATDRDMIGLVFEAGGEHDHDHD